MNRKTGITFSIVAIAAVIVLFASGPLVANQQVQAFPFGGGFDGFHRHFGFNHFGFDGFHRHFGFNHFGFDGFHRHFF